MLRGPGKDFTDAQRSKIYAENQRRNGGVLRSDESGILLVKGSKHFKGVVPPPNEAQIDHICPREHGGTNHYYNAKVLSRKENRNKWDTMPNLP
jgi:5-methylcytosine-specific restriction endonuclease McrA